MIDQKDKKRWRAALVGLDRKAFGSVMLEATQAARGGWRVGFLRYGLYGFGLLCFALVLEYAGELRERVWERDDGQWFALGLILGVLLMLVLIRWFDQRVLSRVREADVVGVLVKRGIRPGFCLRCSYDLRGSVGDGVKGFPRCPECGFGGWREDVGELG